MIPAVFCQKVTILGVGLLGGSLGLALRQRRLAGRVVGHVRRAASVAECTGAGAVDEATLDLAGAVAEADLVVLCTPIGRMRALGEQLLPHLKRGAIVTDVGSVKAGVVAELEPICREAGAHFIGSHPMAGAEKMGVGAARADLYQGAVCVVTPTPQSDAAALARVEALWTALGARVLRLKPGEHDDLVSRSSHLVHLVAAQLAGFVLAPDRPREQAMLCASGFRDTTRVASGSPEMWRDIARANRDALVRALDGFADELRVMRDRVAAGDDEALHAFLMEAKARRDAWVTNGSSPE